MDLSVVIPCYNEYETIEQVVEAVIDSTGPDRQIIIVDDCSTDGTRELLERKIEGRLAGIIYHQKTEDRAQL